MDKEDSADIYNGILLSHKKNEIMSFTATYMDLEIIILSEVSQKQISYKFMWNWIFKMTHELIYKIKTNLQILKRNLRLQKGKQG